MGMINAEAMKDGSSDGDSASSSSDSDAVDELADVVEEVWMVWCKGLLVSLKASLGWAFISY